MLRSCSRRLPVAGLVALGLGVWCSTASASVTVSQSGWTWGNPTPQGNTLRAIDFLSGGIGYAIGDSGTALRTNDGGATWAGLATGTSGSLNRLQIIDANDVVVSDVTGCVLRKSSNGGQSFTKSSLVPTEKDCTDKIQSFSFVSPDNGFAMLQDGSVFKTADGGASFSRVTGVPGTPGGPGAGNAAAEDIHFTSASRGIAFETTGRGTGNSSAYVTVNGGGSWTPVASVDPGTVTRLYFIDAMNAYATGPGTLLRTTDGGNTWKSRGAGAGNNLTSIRCSDPSICLLTVAEGNRLLRTTDGGASVTPITASSSPIFAAAFVSATRAVAVGGNGTTVVSTDAGITYSPISTDIGGQFFRLRSGPANIVLAAGAKGQIARSDDGGTTWRLLSTLTSQDLKDVSFANPSQGYALAANGSLQSTSNSGASWQTLDPGGAVPASAVATVGTNVLLIGPTGIRHATTGGRFTPVAGKILKKASLTDADVVGATAFAFGTKTLLVSTNGGNTWSSVKLPTVKGKGKRKRAVSIKGVAFTSATAGFLLDTSGRVWSTQSRGNRWTEAASTGTSGGQSLAFANPTQGFMSVPSFGNDTGEAFVLRTSDGGRSWRPQLISAGVVPSGGVVATSGIDAYSLVQPLNAGQEGVPAGGRDLFFTHTGGDAGQPSRLTISTPKTKLSRKQLRAAKGKVTISGVLAGAQGGERIAVSRRDQNGGAWTQKVVTAGANGGSFTATFPVTRSSIVVAQWAGDSGRQSAGTVALTIRVK